MRHDRVGDLVGVGDRVSSARAWPADNAPSARSRFVFSGNFNKPQRIGDMAAALADDFRQFVLRIAKFSFQLLIAERFFERIEIGALDVFDDREFERLSVVGLDVMTGTSCRPALCAARQRRSPAMIS